MANKKPPTLNEEIARLNRIVDEAFKESDRAGAILLGAEIDILLKSLLEIYFLPPQKTSIDIFGPDGAVGSFSARIELCYRLGFLHPAMHHDLQIIRKIRNRFAHGEQGLDLSDDQLRDWCHNLIQGKHVEQQLTTERAAKGFKPVKFTTKNYLLLTATVMIANISLVRINIRRTHLWFQDWIKPTEGAHVDIPLGKSDEKEA
jgi:hypothetical protein